MTAITIYARGWPDFFAQLAIAMQQADKAETCPECGNTYLITRCNCKKGENE